MKRFLILFLFLVAGLASAADLTVTVPSAAVPKAQEMCEVLRVELRVPADLWTNNLCATMFTRIGVKVYIDRVERRTLRKSIDSTVQTFIDQFETDWPEPYVRAYCGDGYFDPAFSEECDDGNNVDGDGCSATCLLE